MTKFKLKYNPYTVESVMKINNKEITENSKLFNKKNERMQIWLENLLPILREECNEDEIYIEFHGIMLDFEDLQNHIEEFSRENPGVKVESKHIKAKNTANRIKELDNLFQKMQKECPFEDLKSAEIKANFNKARDSEFEVSVIATMSAGKSTLINALLGREIMPSKNEACTATITRIKDVDSKMNFSAQALNNENVIINEYDDVGIETMAELNDDERVTLIKMEGDIPFIFSKNVQLVLFDTPGPNNSRSQSHKDYAYEIIKEKSKPVVIYVLNATQLAVNDDNYLLGAVAQAMQVGGKQSKDRFMFLVNKIDEFDTENNDSVDDALESVRSYLEEHGIKNPNVYATSAEMAKIIRLYNNGYKMTSKQKAKLDWYKLFNDNEEMHLSKYAPLTQKNRDLLNEEIKDAREKEKVYEEALIHSGIPAVEIAINEYLDKYAITAKVKMAVDTFRKKVEEKQIINNLMDQLHEDEEARKDLNKKLNKIEKQIKDGNAASKFKTEIGKLNMTAEADRRVEAARAKISKSLTLRADKNDKITTENAIIMLKRLQTNVLHLESDIKTELDLILNETIIENAEILIKEYDNHIQSLVADMEIVQGEYKPSSSIGYIKTSIPDPHQLIEKYKYTEQIATGEEWVENTKKRWFNPFTWFQKKGWWRTIYKDEAYVSGKVIYENFVRPITENFFKNLAAAKEMADKEAEKFKEFFLEELDQLDKAIERKLTELKELSASRKNLESLIEENKSKKEWLEKFLSELDGIIEI